MAGEMLGNARWSMLSEEIVHIILAYCAPAPSSMLRAMSVCRAFREAGASHKLWYQSRLLFNIKPKFWEPPSMLRYAAARLGSRHCRLCLASFSTAPSVQAQDLQNQAHAAQYKKLQYPVDAFLKSHGFCGVGCFKASLQQFRLRHQRDVAYILCGPVFICARTALHYVSMSYIRLVLDWVVAERGSAVLDCEGVVSQYALFHHSEIRMLRDFILRLPTGVL
ncbi:hypothetical protein BC830DRAFT_1087551 [Chytriomyces sp. MP71]|nr:hypothetical protein BC830DRAFT_1087551 [Chytriomyces sp. MP71]